MKKALILGSLFVALLIVEATAGWTHFNKQTMFVPDPTPATVWTRNNQTHDLYLMPSASVQVFDNTLKVVTNGVAVTSYGYWTINADGNYVQIAANLDLYTMRHLPGAVLDVEWEMTATGNFIPKE